MLYPIDTPTRETKCLDGLWRLAIDKERIGKQETWYQTDPGETVEVAVPGSINEQFVNRELYTYLDWVWYFREFYVPASWAVGKRVFIHFGSATHRADIYCNGTHLGSHEGGFTPFEFEITDHMIAGGKNRLCVRLDNLLDETTIPQGNLDPSVGGVAAWRPGNFPNVHYDVFPYMGIHRPVTLYATGADRIEKLFITTLALENERVIATFKLHCSGDLDWAEITIAELGFNTELPIEENGCEAKFDIPGAAAWSPESPKLYDIEIAVKKRGVTTDIYTLPFGFRTIEVRGGGSSCSTGLRSFFEDLESTRIYLLPEKESHSPI